MLLHLSTWAEIEQYLKRSRAIVVPIGSNEQHGPTGLLGTDWLCPEIIAREAQKSADILVAPTFNIGMAQHHLGFPGTISLRPSTFIAAIGDWIRSLAAHGFEKILFLNGHGGNIASIEAAFSEVYVEASFAKRHAGFAMKLANWWDLEGVGELAREQFPKDTAFTLRRPRSRSRSGPSRTRSNPPTTRRKSRRPARFAKRWISARATRMAAWARTRLRHRRKRAVNWCGWRRRASCAN